MKLRLGIAKSNSIQPILTSTCGPLWTIFKNNIV